ncbi:MAG: glycosyltransferase family 4 protein [Bacteroidales bacterium]
MARDREKRLRIVLLSHFPFPYGLAVTNRLIAYARGLAEAGHKVEVLVMKPTEDEKALLNKETSGDYLGIKFQYTSGTTLLQRSVQGRIRASFLGYVRTLQLLSAGANRPKADLVIMVGPQSFLRTLGLWLFTRVRKISLWQERSEYPFLTNKPGIRFQLELFLYLRITCRLLDGMIVITKALDQYFRKFLRKNVPSYILPILVEVDRFSNTEGNRPGYSYLAYCGSMEGEKDGLPDLIRAFHLLAAEFPKEKLVLIGSTGFDGFAALKQRVVDPGLADRVVFTGRIERDQLPGWLKGARALVLARPANKQAEGGFPTKLGEYLATGRPVVVTRTGEIPEFLTDMKDAYLATPGDPEDVAAKLRLLLSSPEQAERIGKEGLETARRCFGYKEQAEKMGEFFTSLK